MLVPALGEVLENAVQLRDAQVLGVHKELEQELQLPVGPEAIGAPRGGLLGLQLLPEVTCRQL